MRRFTEFFAICCSSSATGVPVSADSSASRAASRSVWVRPGWTTVTLMPCGPSSSARFFVTAATLTFRTVWAMEFALRAPSPLMLMIRPQPCSIR